jgi:hypothetical protein
LPYAINKYIPYNALNPFIKNSFFFYQRKKECIRYLHKDYRKYRQLLRKAKSVETAKGLQKKQNILSTQYNANVLLRFQYHYIYIFEIIIRIINNYY